MVRGDPSSDRRRLLETYRDPLFVRRHDPDRRGNRYLTDRRWRVIRAALGRLAVGRGGGRYLEIGCGDGTGLDQVASAGLGFAEIVGVDILMERSDRASARRPDVHVICADATCLPFSSGSFDYLVQCMLLTSVLSSRSRVQVAREIVRVIRPGGHFLSLDLRYPALPRRGRIGLGLGRLRRLFSGMSLVTSDTHVILPPLARLLAGRAPICDRLAAIAVLRAYRLAVFVRPDVDHPLRDGEARSGS